MSNLILNTDSYKYSHFNQYPSGTEYIYSYVESRGGKWNSTVYLGLQAFIKEYLSKPISMNDINEAEKFVTEHGLPFYREGWEYILEHHNGYLPVEIRGVEEGTIIPTHNVLVTVINTDPKCFWLTSFLETSLLRAIWYPTSVATNSYETKKIILEFLNRNGDPSLIDFKLHDFGARGVSSLESAGLGGMAHLVNFKGSDTVTGVYYANKYYDAGMAGFSIPAMEHSTVTSWGRDHEIDSFRNMLNNYAKPGSLVACVSDSYDIYNACKMWGTELKEQVINSGATIVVRPDSGNPTEVVVKCAQILDRYFGSTINNKGSKVLNNVRIIQGDGINHTSIRSILFSLDMAGYSADNVAFGQGGALLQGNTRDTLKFAMKCSAIRIKGEWHDVFKDPITDHGKMSKKGLLMLSKENNNFITIPLDNKKVDELMPIRYRNGKITNTINFDQVRKNANISIS